jgi:hypothetical protein
MVDVAFFDLRSFRLIELLDSRTLISFRELLRLRLVCRACRDAVETVCALMLSARRLRSLHASAAAGAHSSVLAVALVRRKELAMAVPLEPRGALFCTRFHPFAHRGLSLRNVGRLLGAAFVERFALAATIGSPSPTTAKAKSASGLDLRLDDDLGASALHLAATSASALFCCAVCVSWCVSDSALSRCVVHVAASICVALFRVARKAPLLEYASARASFSFRDCVGVAAFRWRLLQLCDTLLALLAPPAALQWSVLVVCQLAMFAERIDDFTRLNRAAVLGREWRQDARRRFSVGRPSKRALDVRACDLPDRLRWFAGTLVGVGVLLVAALVVNNATQR